MPPLGSSVINKSGKKVVPRAPARRPAPHIPAQTSISASLASVETSLKPRPDSTPPTAEVTDRASSQALITDPDILAEITKVSDGLTSKRPRNGRLVESYGADTESHPCGLAASSHHFSEQDPPVVSEITAHSNKLVPGVHELGQSAQNGTYASQRSIPTIITTIHPEPTSRSSPSISLPSLVQHERPEIGHGGAQPAKRRKLRPDRTTKPSAPQIAQDSVPERNSNTQVQVQVPLRKSAAKGKGRQLQGPAGGKVRARTIRDQVRREGDSHGNTKVRKARQTTSARNSQRLRDAAAEVVADAVEGAANRSNGRRGRKAREPTPEAAEDEIIAPGAIKMAELCKDTRKGKKSDTLKALQERDKEEGAKEKQRELQRLMEGERQLDPEGSGGQANAGTANSDVQRPSQEVSERSEDVVREVADTYVDEQGQIRINTDSLRIDRHAQAAAAREQNQDEAVVENDLSKPAVNSQTYLKREPLNSWPEQLTDEFYEALRTFGTDFGMICRMLRKTRRAVKLKFNREEKANPGRINQALLGAKINIDLDEYSRRAGENIKETEEHNRKMEEDRKKIEEDAADELRAKEEQEQLRREQAENERAAVPDDSSNKENREGGRKKREGRKSRETGRDHSGRKRKKKGAADEEITQIT
ncbi:MAG: hypothetical protein LQ346_000191 [Caloplaca aetnensis]|nr:MAG: hypothetical protein LQ346_000191 [Caloplaca aetnensis]